jgi:superfamily II DNA or RNA helicase
VTPGPAWQKKCVVFKSIGDDAPVERQSDDAMRLADRRPSHPQLIESAAAVVHKGVANDCVAEYGHLIVDECHHLSAQSVE